MKKNLLLFVSFFLFTSLLHAEADYVYHEASTNTIGTGTLRFREVMSPDRSQSMKIGFKIEFQFYWNQARIYYTTDGTNPSGAFGVGTGTTQVLTTTNDHTFGSPVVDAVFATIPAQPAGTVVRYIVSAWHSGGGDEIFGNGCGNAPRTFCSSDNRLSSQATVFSYTVQPLRYYVNDNSLTGDIYTTAIGNDVNNGLSPATPKATVGSVLSTYAITGGDTIYIDKGSYTQSFTLDGANANTVLQDQGQSLNSYLVIKGAGAANTIMTAATSQNVYINRANFIWIEGINFINSAANGYNILKEYGRSTCVKACTLDITSSSPSNGQNIFFRCNYNSIYNGHRSLITGNVINNSSDGIGVYVWGDVDSSRFEKNTINMTGPTNGTRTWGFYFHYRTFGGEEFWPIIDTITNNRITTNRRGLVFESVASREFIKYLIDGNTIINNNSTIGVSIYLQNCGYDNTDDFKIYRNRLIGGNTGVYIVESCQYLKVHNNYFCNNYGLFGLANASGIDVNSSFLHNSVYAAKSCLFFDGKSNRGWNIQNNILYSYATTSTEACIRIANATSLKLRQSNGNLFYIPPGASASIGIYQGTNYDFAAWKLQDFTTDLGNNDPNSISGIAPNFQARDNNCDLDLLPDLSIWTTGFPNNGNSLISNSAFVLGGGTGMVSSDIKNIPTRAYWTIGAFEAGSTTLLPVNLISFNARLAGRKVMLDWQTASETNSDFFDVERSKSGTSEWAFVSRMNGRGYANNRSDYQSVDHKPYEGVSYYRLKMVDNDGRVSYSPIRKVVNEAGVISIYPNPAQGYVLISGLNKNKLNMLHLLDVSGKLLQEHFVKDIQFRIDLSDLSFGVYYLSINGEQHFQFVKNK